MSEKYYIFLKENKGSEHFLKITKKLLQIKNTYNYSGKVANFLQKDKKMRLLFIILFSISIACSQFQKTATNKYIETSGFSNENTFIALIKVKPETRTGSLVERRETAYMEAKINIKQFALQELVNYARTVQCANGNTTIDPKRMERFVQKGYISDEYYDPDGTVNLIYLIKTRSLRNKIHAAACKQK